MRGKEGRRGMEEGGREMERRELGTGIRRGNLRSLISVMLLVPIQEVMITRYTVHLPPSLIFYCIGICMSTI